VQEKYNVAKDEVLFVSSNGWDAAGATGYGFQTAWVNRGGDPVDRMPHRPKHILKDLSELAALVL
jgi:2-haloacid dehalogenase